MNLKFRVPKRELYHKYMYHELFTSYGIFKVCYHTFMFCCCLLYDFNFQQRRTKGDVFFNRDWDSYKEGFGELDGDFWLGNEAIHILTYVVMTDLDLFFIVLYLSNDLPISFLFYFYISISCYEAIFLLNFFRPLSPSLCL